MDITPATISDLMAKSATALAAQDRLRAKMAEVSAEIKQGKTQPQTTEATK